MNRKLISLLILFCIGCNTAEHEDETRIKSEPTESTVEPQNFTYILTIKQEEINKEILVQYHLEDRAQEENPFVAPSSKEQIEKRAFEAATCRIMYEVQELLKIRDDQVEIMPSMRLLLVHSQMHLVFPDEILHYFENSPLESDKTIRVGPD